MVQVRSRGASAGPSTATARHHRQVSGANESKPTYKVVVEETLRPRRKLITSTYPEREPPRGYTFVPAGDPKLTAQCKEFARQDGARIYVVSTTKHQDTALSMEVHRIGYHFPSTIVERAYIALGAPSEMQKQLASPKKAMPGERSRKERSRKGLKRIGNKALQHLHQTEVDQEARQAILDLFPAIPKEDLDIVISRAFDLGKRNVGTQFEDLSLPRRVQLAVVAHIRHVYTDYDNLLKQVPWLQARSMIEQASLDKLAQWRGSEEEDPDAMEEILQEVIIIPDDDDDQVDARDQADPTIHEQDHESSYWRSGRQPPASTAAGMHGKGFESDSTGKTEAAIVQDLGGGQYLIAGERSVLSERARLHQEEAWRQAQTRVRNDPQSSHTFVDRVARVHVPPVATDRPPVRVQHSRHRSGPSLLSYGTEVTTGFESASTTGPIARSGAPTRFIPEIVPSIEPRTPRTEGRIDCAQSPRDTEVIFIDSPEGYQGRPRTQIIYEAAQNMSSYDDRHVYRPEREWAATHVDPRGNPPMRYHARRTPPNMDVIPITANEWEAANPSYRIREASPRLRPLRLEMPALRQARPAYEHDRQPLQHNEVYVSGPHPGETRREPRERYYPHPADRSAITHHRDEPTIISLDSPRLLRVEPHEHRLQTMPTSYTPAAVARREYVEDVIPVDYRRRDRPYETQWS